MCRARFLSYGAHVRVLFELLVSFVLSRSVPAFGLDGVISGAIQFSEHAVV